MVTDWLTKKISVAEAEAEHKVTDERLGPDPVSFGFQHDRWVALLNRMEDADELWEFKSPSKTWRNMCGRKGIAVVRNGEIIDSIVTLMN